MKKIIAVYLCLGLLLSLAACASKPQEKKTAEEGVDISALSAEELYRAACEKNKGLASSSYHTVISINGVEQSEFDTIRVRKGYEGFEYSREGDPYYYFDNETAWISGDLGSYTAPATAADFQAFLDSCVYPVTALPVSALTDIFKDNLTVTYRSENEALLALYSEVSPGFSPRSLSGKATVNQDLVLTEETVTVTGYNAVGSSVSYVLSTELHAYRSDAITPAEVNKNLPYIAVDNINLPATVQRAKSALLSLDNLQATLVLSQKAATEKQSFSHAETITLYYKTEGTIPSYYRSQQSHHRADKEESSFFTQSLLKNGSLTENRFNLFTGEKLSEETRAESNPLWQEDLKTLIPALSQLAALTVVEDATGYSISFTLTEDAATKRLSDTVALFPDSGLSVPAPSAMAGTLSIDKKSGVLTALSFSVKGEAVEAHYSLLVDAIENIELPELQTPSATTGMDPGQAEHAD